MTLDLPAYVLRSLPSWSLVLLSVTAAGCATERAGPPVKHDHIVVLELPPTPSERSLRRVLHGKRENVIAATLAADRDHINQALDEDLRRSLPAAVHTLTRIDFVPFDQPGASAIGRPIEGAALPRLESSLPADSYLRIRVTDYGETPRRWEAAYIGFEVVSTLAIAGALYVHKLTRPVAAAYLAEESVEEISEGYAGFWTLNRLSRPVRIEADMVDGLTGRILWREAHTGLARWRWRNLRHMDDTARDALLEASLGRAVEAFAKSLGQRERRVAAHGFLTSPRPRS